VFIGQAPISELPSQWHLLLEPSTLALLDSLPTAVVFHDQDGVPYLANLQARKLFGVGNDRGISVARVAAAAQIYVADTDARYPLELLPATAFDSAAESRVHSMEIRRADGTVHLEVWVKSTFSANGELQFTAHTFVDVSERKNTAADLVLSELLTKAVATEPGFADVLETSLHEICQLTGWTFGQAWLPDTSGTSLRCRYAWHEDLPAYREFHESCRAIVLPLGRGLPGRVWLSKKWEWNGESEAPVTYDVGKDASVLLTGHRGSVAMPVLVGGEVVAVLEFLVMVGGSQDTRSVDRVTSVISRAGVWMSTKGAEDAAIRGDERFRQIAENTADAIIFASEDTRIRYLNPSAEALFGYTAAEVAGLLMSELIHDRIHRDSDVTTGYYPRLRQNGSTERPVHLTAVRKSGVRFPVEVTLTSWRDDGETFLTAIVRDSSDRVRTEGALRETLGIERKAHEQLQVLDALKYTLLQAVAHDLRSPIAAVLILTGMLRAETDQLSHEKRAPLLIDIERSMRKMSQLLQDLLDSDPDQPMEARRRECDVGQLVQHLLAESGLQNNHPVHTDLASVVVNVDAVQVERIIENLITNAEKYVDEGVPIWIRTSAVPDGVLIVVEDAGRGVPADIAEEIFEPFSRGANSTMLGLGLGLSLVSRFAALHHGRAWVEDRPGGGASFRVLLPNTEATDHDHAA
jgi:PAS domain S-box-containing protein